MKILIVDDNLDAAESMSDIFAVRGHSVTIVDSGVAAIRLYETQRFGVVFMDLRMEGIQGDEAVREILKIDPAARIAVVTGNSDGEDQIRVEASGIIGVIRKPYDPETLLDIVEREASSRPGASGIDE